MVNCNEKNYTLNKIPLDCFSFSPSAVLACGIGNLLTHTLSHKDRKET